MLRHIDIEEAKTQLDSLLQTALAGNEIIILRNNEPVLRLMPIAATQKRRQPGTAKGQIVMTSDFDASLADFAEYME